MPLAKQVILFVIDGLRPDALQQIHTSQIDGLVARGAYTWRAQTVTPSISLPCHTSLFFAVPPARRGVLSNVWTPLQAACTQPHRGGASGWPGHSRFYTWEELRDLASPGALDFAHYHRLGDPEGDRDLGTGAVAATYIVQQRPAFAFVYLGAADEVGHRHGWMSAPYLRAVNKADRAIGLVLEALRASGHLAGTVCLVLADHGGQDFDHDAGLAEDLTVPWIISRPGIHRGSPDHQRRQHH